jgi:UDP-N-acetylglucosamine 1-carboxyvinyltransferase
MTKYIIKGGGVLRGEAYVQGAKNAILPIYAAAMLTNEEVIISNVPDLADVENMGKILVKLGARLNKTGQLVSIKAENFTSHNIPIDMAKVLRSSIFLLGSILGRERRAVVAYPGGCDIGSRPIDIHIKALRSLNVKIEEQEGYLVCDATDMKCGAVTLDYPSVGATENVILASALNIGTTIIDNAALEPEIVALADYLNASGARVYGAGTSRVRVEGVRCLHGAEITAMPDRIAAGTLILAAAATGGELCLKGARSEDIEALLTKLDESACNVTVEGGMILVQAKRRRLSADYIATQPHPGFPTDLQAPMMALQTVTEGTCMFVENIFENRYRHVAELLKMGADIRTSGRTAFVKGVPALHGAEVDARDLRGGAALVIAGLAAEGTTVVNDVLHIDRGYDRLEEVLRRLGADIERV